MIVMSWVVLAIIIVVQNYLFIKIDTKRREWWYLGVNFIINIVTVLTLINVLPHEEKIGNVALCFFLINTIQIIFIEYVMKEIRKPSVTYYTMILVIPVLVMQAYFFDVIAGLSMIYLLLFVLQVLRKHRDYIIAIYSLVIGDVILLALTVLYDTDSILMTVIYGGIQIVFISFLLLINYKENIRNNFIVLKIIGFVTYAVNIMFITYYLTHKYFLSLNYESTYEVFSSYVHRDEIASFLALCLFIAVMVASGYMKDWWDKDFKWFHRLCHLKQDYTYIPFYAVTYITLHIGLWIINSYYIESVIDAVVLIGGILAVALIQSGNLIKYYKKYQFIGIWIGLKYLIITWIILSSLTNISFESVLISLSGLVVAILCIALGFGIKIKNLRLYGLILTIVMVFKFILVDLQEENSITRVISLLIGGLICFGITILYNKLNKGIENEQFND